MKSVFYHKDAGLDPKLPPLTVVVEEVPEKNERMSDAGGVPVFDRVVYMEVTPIGQKSGVIYCPRRILPDGTEKLDQTVIKRFRGLWEEWLRGATPSTDGTPLEQWPLMDVALVASLKEAHIYTVQQLAGLPDGAFDNVRIPKVREWRAKAIAWLEAASQAGQDVEARATIARQQQQIDELQVMVQQLQSKNVSAGFDKKSRRKSTPDDSEAAAALSHAEPVEEDLRL